MKYVSALLFAAVLFSVLPSHTQTEWTLEANLPFSFMVGDQTVSAGPCTFVLNSGRNRLMIRSRSTNVTTNGGHLRFTGDILAEVKNELVFHRIGKEYFLAEVWIHNQGLSMTKPKRQVELEEAGSNPVVVSVKVKTS